MPLGRTQCREQSLKVDRKKSKKAWYNLNTYASVSKILWNNIRFFGDTSSFKVRIVPKCHFAYMRSDFIKVVAAAIETTLFKILHG